MVFAFSGIIVTSFIHLSCKHTCTFADASCLFQLGSDPTNSNLLPLPIAPKITATWSAITQTGMNSAHRTDLLTKYDRPQEFKPLAMNPEIVSLLADRAKIRTISICSQNNCSPTFHQIQLKLKIKLQVWTSFNLSSDY